MEEFREEHDIKYMRELQEYWDAYMYALISEIYVGTGIALGLSAGNAYKLAKNKPGELQKAGFFKGIFDKFKSIFSNKISWFRPKRINIDKMTPERWDKFNRGLDKYWRNHVDSISEDMAVKGFLAGRETTNFIKKKKPYKNKSLYQVIEDQYQGKIPKNIDNVYKKYDFKNSEKKALNNAFSSIAMNVTKTNNEIKESIRKQVQQGIDDNKSATMIASDLYWNVEKDEKLVNKYTAETMRRNWNRVSSTELSAVHEAGVLAPYEAEAAESLRNPDKAKYFARVGGTCKWCQSKAGTIVRLVPKSIALGGTESLKEMGIHDPNTDIAIWIGKNNVGRKQVEFWICCPAHPYNVATFNPIDLKTEFYNPKTGDVERRQERKKFVPKKLDYSQRNKEEKEYAKPAVIGDNLVRMGSNVYEAVDPGEYNTKLERWKRDTMLPIPVNRSGPQYIRIFEEARKQ